eukprot:UN21680
MSMKFRRFLKIRHGEFFLWARENKISKLGRRKVSRSDLQHYSKLPPPRTGRFLSYSQKPRLVLTPSLL